MPITAKDKEHIKDLLKKIKKSLVLFDQTNPIRQVKGLQDCLEALKNLDLLAEKDDEHRTHILKKCLKLLPDLLTHENDEIKTNAVRVLGSIAHCEAMRARMIEKNVVALLRPLLERKDDRLLIQETRTALALFKTPEKPSESLADQRGKRKKPEEAPTLNKKQTLTEDRSLLKAEGSEEFAHELLLMPPHNQAVHLHQMAEKLSTWYKQQKENIKNNREKIRVCVYKIMYILTEFAFRLDKDFPGIHAPKVHDLHESNKKFLSCKDSVSLPSVAENLSLLISQLSPLFSEFSILPDPLRAFTWDTLYEQAKDNKPSGANPATLSAHARREKDAEPPALLPLETHPKISTTDRLEEATITDIANEKRWVKLFVETTPTLLSTVLHKMSLYAMNWYATHSDETSEEAKEYILELNYRLSEYAMRLEYSKKEFKDFSEIDLSCATYEKEIAENLKFLAGQKKLKKGPLWQGALLSSVHKKITGIHHKDFTLAHLLDVGYRSLDELLKPTIAADGLEEGEIDETETAAETDRAESTEKPSYSRPIGPRHLDDPEWELVDVDDMGNCFYEAVIDQMKLYAHPFLETVHETTSAQDALRLLIGGNTFADREWADDGCNPAYENLVKKCNVVLAIVDTCNPNNGFHARSYTNEDGIINHIADEGIPLPEDKIVIRLAATGDHFLSVRKHPELTQGVLKKSFDSTTLGTRRVAAPDLRISTEPQSHTPGFFSPTKQPSSCEQSKESIREERIMLLKEHIASFKELLQLMRKDDSDYLKYLKQNNEATRELDRLLAEKSRSLAPTYPFVQSPEEGAKHDVGDSTTPFLPVKTSAPREKEELLSVIFGSGKGMHLPHLETSDIPLDQWLSTAIDEMATDTKISEDKRAIEFSKRFLDQLRGSPSWVISRHSLKELVKTPHFLDCLPNILHHLFDFYGAIPKNETTKKFKDFKSKDFMVLYILLLDCAHPDVGDYTEELEIACNSWKLNAFRLNAADPNYVKEIEEICKERISTGARTRVMPGILPMMNIHSPSTAPQSREDSLRKGPLIAAPTRR